MPNIENDGQVSATYPPDYHIPPQDEDEIHLLDLFIILLKHKVMIISLVILTGIGAVIYSLQLPDIYRSEAIIAPTAQEKGAGGLASLGGLGAMIASEAGINVSGSIDQFNVVLKSRELTHIIIEKHNLMPVLFKKSWDDKGKRWTTEKPPLFDDAYKRIHGLLAIMPDKKQNILRLSFELEDPRLTQTILNYYITGLSEFLRNQTLEEAAAHQVHLAQQLTTTGDPLLKNKLYELIARQIEKETLAKIQKYYSFNVIDPSFVPERKFKPKRAQICIISVLVAFFIAIFLAFFREYVHNLKTHEDPERLNNLKKYLRFRNS
ncbi:MAG: Wzz/FepE/Etk N-terminal domain-containing protein [Smithellaceae bacterium]|nr:Wzz/FepE/Etk N-terminal domain-containing protein [Smithellaceae bacterium]